MRALAVLAVVIFHLDRSWLPGGFVGVDIFFVISGYLITGIILGDLERDEFTLSRFFQRRIARIFPAFITVGLATLLGAALAYTAQDFASAGISLAAAVLSLANLKFMLQGNYFQVSPDAQPLLHCWSLSVEEQFYLLFPLALVALHRRARRHVLPVLAGLAIGSFLLCVVMTHTRPVWAFYLLPTRAWEMLAGAVLAIGMARNRATAGVPTSPWMAIAGLALILASFALLGEGADFPGWRAGPPVLGAALMLSQAGATETLLARLLSSRVLTTVGKVSFSLYLWHWPVFALVDYGMCLSSSSERLFAKLALTALLVWLTYLVVERPARRFLNERRNKKTAYAFFATALVLTVSLGVLIRRTQYVGAEMSDIPGGGLVFRSGSNTKSVVLMGDSNGSMYGKVLKEVCADLGYKLTILSVTAEDPLPSAVGNGGALWAGSLAVVRRERPDVLVLACDWSQKLAQDRSRLQSALADLSPCAGRILILNQPPSPPAQASRAGLREGERPPFFEDTSKSRGRRAVNAYLETLASPSVHIVHVAEPFELPEGEVRFLDARNRLLYHDAGHLSGYGAELVRPMIRMKLLQE